MSGTVPPIPAAPRAGAPGDAQGAAALLLAAILAAGTALSSLVWRGQGFPPPTDLGVGKHARLDSPRLGGPMAASTGSRALPTRGNRVKRPVTGILDLNTGESETLQALPGIGPTLAQRIVAHRETNGPFKTPEDVLQVPGIGPKRWERIRPMVRAPGAPEGP